MGESWGDLTAGEYMFSHGYSNGANPWAVGPYATGNKAVGIRDYADQRQPAELLRLRLRQHRRRGARRRRDLERHPVGGAPGARQEVERDASPTPTRRLQLRCAEATADQARRCPPTGARATAAGSSWSSTPSCSSRARPSCWTPATRCSPPTGCASAAPDQTVDVAGLRLARHGQAAPRRPTPTPATRTPGFASPRARNGTVPFPRRATGKVYVGRYEARATPVADTDPAHARSGTRHAGPGRYRDAVRRRRSRGFSRFTVRVAAGPAPDRARCRRRRNLAARRRRAPR